MVVASAGAATITVGSHILAPDTPAQQVEISVAGGDAVSGINLFAQVGDGGPELADYGLPAGTDGPAITAVDLITGTIFVAKPATQFPVDPTLPQFVNYGLILSEPGQSVPAAGLLVTLTIDTSGFSTGTWDLLLGDVLPELGPYDTDFAPTAATIINGSITMASPGDANGDCIVNLLDLGIVGDNWNGTGKGWKEGDFNGDGTVDLIDLGVVGDNWNTTVCSETEGTASDAVPEPSTLTLLILGAMAALPCRARRSSP